MLMWTAIEQALRDVQYAVDKAKSEAEDNEAIIVSLKEQLEEEGSDHAMEIQGLDEQIADKDEEIHVLEVKLTERDEEIDALKARIADLESPPSITFNI